MAKSVRPVVNDVDRVRAAAVEAAGAASVELRRSRQHAGARGIIPAGAGSQWGVAAGLRGGDVEPSRTVLPNGLTVISTTDPGVRSIALGAWVRAGSLHEPFERMGASHLREHTALKATEQPSAREGA